MLRALGAIALVISSGRPAKDMVPPAPPEALQKNYANLQSAQDVHTRARRFYLLNDAADRYALSLNEAGGRLDNPQIDPRVFKERTSQAVQTANRYGAEITWCEFDGDWTASSHGYEVYLHLWPRGPLAEESWWRSRLLNKLNACYDGDGSREETFDSLQSYAKFLTRFPKGKHHQEATERLRQLQTSQTGG